MQPAAEREVRPMPDGLERADMHVHSTMSDGSLTFEEVLAQAIERGVEKVAFTNHDTTRGLGSAVELGRRMGVCVLGGIEISAMNPGTGAKVHVLGYGLREHSPAIAALCEPLLLRRNANSLWQLDRLLEAGFGIDASRALSLGAAGTCLYKQHLMAALTDAPYESVEYKALYCGLFKGEGLCARDIEYVDARDAVRAIVEDGGHAVLAHPGQLESWDMVAPLVEVGLEGIEYGHPDHGPADRKRCACLAERYGLSLTQGSDYHGAFGSVPHVGFGVAGVA